MNSLEILLKSFHDFSFCDEVPAELPAMSSELAALRSEIERFYYRYVDIQGSNGNCYTLAAVAEPEGYDRLTLTPGVVAELVRIHDFLLLRESREMFRDLLHTRDAVEIRIVDDDTNVPF